MATLDSGLPPNVAVPDSSSSAPPASSSSSQKPKRFTIVNWNAVSLWDWDPDLEFTCIICERHINDRCNHCRVKNCTTVVKEEGVCTHTLTDSCSLIEERLKKE